MTTIPSQEMISKIPLSDKIASLDFERFTQLAPFLNATHVQEGMENVQNILNQSVGQMAEKSLDLPRNEHRNPSVTTSSETRQPSTAGPLRALFCLMEGYLGRTTNHLPLPQARLLKEVVLDTFKHTIWPAAKLDANAASVASNGLALLDTLSKSPYAIVSANELADTLSLSMDKMKATSGWLGLERLSKDKNPTYVWVQALCRYFEKSNGDASALNQVEGLIQRFLKAGNLETGQPHETAWYRNLNLYVLYVANRWAQSLQSESDKQAVQRHLDQWAIEVTEARKHAIKESNIEGKADALQQAKEDLYLHYILPAYGPQEGVAASHPISPEHYTVMRKKEVLPNQTLVRIAPDADKRHPGFEVELHYHQLDSQQLQHVEARLKQACDLFLDAWIRKGLNKPATEGPIKLRMHIQDSETQYKRFGTLWGYDTNNGGYTLPTSEGDAYQSNSWVYQENKGKGAWHVRNLAHEAAHGFSYYLFGKQAFSEVPMAFAEGFSEALIDKQDSTTHIKAFLNGLTPEEQNWGLKDILKLKYGWKDGYDLSHLMVRYMQDSGYIQRAGLVEAFKENDPNKIKQLLTDFATQEQAGFSSWLQNVKETPEMKTVESHEILYQKLKKAIESNDIDQVKLCLNENTPLRDPSGKVSYNLLLTAVKAAVQRKEWDVTVIEALLKKDPSLLSHRMETRSLALSERYGRKELVAQYLNEWHRERSVTPISEQGKVGTVWQQAKHAIEEDPAKLASLLPQLGAQLTRTDELGQTLFHHAAKAGNKQALHALAEQLKKQLDERNHTTRLYINGRENFINGIETYRLYNYFLSSQDSKGDTPLHLAKNEVSAQALVELGARIDVKNRVGQTPEKKAQIQDPIRLAPLFKQFALRKEFGKQVKALGDQYSDILTNKKKLDHNQIIQKLSRLALDFLQAVDKVLASNLKPVWQTGSLLHIVSALGTGNLEQVIPKLLSRNIDIHQRDWEGNTPLHIAIQNRKFSTIRTLLKHGASLDIPNQAGNTPRDIANLADWDGVMHQQFTELNTNTPTQSLVKHEEGPPPAFRL